MFHFQSTRPSGQSPLSILSPVTDKRNLTSSPFLSVFRPDQKRCAHVLTARPWSGFFRSFDAARAHWVLKGSWFSSLKHFILSKVPMIKVIAASCALESLISSSYRENAWQSIEQRIFRNHPSIGAFSKVLQNKPTLRRSRTFTPVHAVWRGISWASTEGCQLNHKNLFMKHFCHYLSVNLGFLLSPAAQHFAALRKQCDYHMTKFPHDQKC